MVPKASISSFFIVSTGLKIIFHFFLCIILGGHVPPSTHSRGGSTKQVIWVLLFSYFLIL